jgi:tetrahydromethanopterin S-methyltransferase subunit G
MTMTMPEEKWTDERLDDLNKKIDDGSVRGDTGLRELKGEMNHRFDKVDARFDKVEGEMNERFDKVDRRFDKVEGEMNERFDKVDRRFDKVEGKMESGMTELRGEIKGVNGQLLALHKLLVTISIGAAATVGITLIAAIIAA